MDVFRKVTKLEAERDELRARCERLEGALRDAREAIASQPEDAFGCVAPVFSDDTGYYVRDALIDTITKAIAATDRHGQVREDSQGSGPRGRLTDDAQGEARRGDEQDNALIDDFIDGYELRGDEGCHEPSDFERFLLRDFTWGLLQALDDGEFNAAQRGEGSGS